MAGADHNKMSRHDFLRRILQSGEVTRIAQHLALAIVVLCEDCEFKASVRDLERITGWSKTMIADHLAELEVFMKITLGVGRGKTAFELHGMIEDALNKAIVAGSREPVASATRTQRTVTVRHTDAIADATADTKSYVPPADATADMSATRTQDQPVASATRTQTKSAPATQPAAYKDTRASKESPSEIVITKKESASSSSSINGVIVNCETITGPGFVISLRAVDMEASLRSIPKEFGRAKAEAMAQQWAASGKPPQNPDATIARAFREEANAIAVQSTRLGKAAGAKAKDPNAERQAAEAFERSRRAEADEDERCRR